LIIRLETGLPFVVEAPAKRVPLTINAADMITSYRQRDHRAHVNRYEIRLVLAGFDDAIAESLGAL
jgi:hypothetical protein